jgi:hypothetical protein
MNALSRIFSRDPSESNRTSKTILAEINALEHPLQYRNMTGDIGDRRARLVSLTGQARKDADAEIADLVAKAVEYRSRHAQAIDREDELYRELATVQRSEHQQFLSSRTAGHNAEDARCAKLAKEVRAAETELTAQRLATHYLAKKWGLETAYPHSFGYPSVAVEGRTAVILAEISRELGI